MKIKLSVILRIFVSVGLVAFLLWSLREELPRIGNTLINVNLLLFSSAVLLFMANLGVLSFRLRLLFVGEGLRIPFGRIIQLTYIGYFFNNIMPTAVGGDIIKAYYAYRQTKETAKSFISVFMDRFIGLFSFMCIAAIALSISWTDIAISLKKIVFSVTLFGLLSFAIIINSTVANMVFKLFSKLKLWGMGEKLSKVYRAVHEYKNKKMLILAALGVSVICQSIYFIIIYLLAKSFGVDVLLKTVFLIMPLVSVISAVLPSLGGLGLREGAIVVLMGPIIGVDNAFSISILLLATLLIISLIGALIYALASQFKFKKEEVEVCQKYL